MHGGDKQNASAEASGQKRGIDEQNEPGGKKHKIDEQTKMRRCHGCKQWFPVTGANSGGPWYYTVATRMPLKGLVFNYCKQCHAHHVLMWPGKVVWHTKQEIEFEFEDWHPSNAWPRG